MTFEKILIDFLEGEKIRKAGWFNDMYIQFHPENKSFRKILDEENKLYTITEEDILDDDWEIYDDTDYFDWNLAYKAMKEGKIVSRKELEGCIYLEDGYFYDSNYEYYTISEEDLESNYWYLVESGDKE